MAKKRGRHQDQYDAYAGWQRSVNKNKGTQMNPGQKRMSYYEPLEISMQRTVPTSKTWRGKHKQYKASRASSTRGSHQTLSKHGMHGWQSGRTMKYGSLSYTNRYGAR